MSSTLLASLPMSLLSSSRRMLQDCPKEMHTELSRVSEFTLKGTGLEREGCCGQQHEGGRAHPFDPRHDVFHELNTTVT
jgi:hypothetical protein